MLESIKLKPCPFCGTKMEIKSTFYPADEPEDEDTTFYDYTHSEEPKTLCPLYEQEKAGYHPDYTDKNIEMLLNVVRE